MWLTDLFKNKVKNESKKISNSFKKRDTRISRVEEEIKDIKKSLSQINSNSERLARIEGAVSVLINNKSKSQSQPSIKQSHNNIETKIINRVKRNKKALVMAEIKKLEDSHTIIEIFEIIVREKGLCSKASFYRYVAGLKSQKLVSIERN